MSTHLGIRCHWLNDQFIAQTLMRGCKWFLLYHFQNKTYKKNLFKNQMTNTTSTTSSTLWSIGNHLHSQLNQLKSENVIIIIAFSVLISRIACIIWKKLVHNYLLNYTVRKLEREIALLKKKSIAFNTPSTFAQYAKLERRWKERERKLSSIQTSTSYWVRVVLSNIVQYMLSYAMPALCVWLWYSREDSLFILARESWCCLGTLGERPFCIIPQFLCSSKGLPLSVIGLTVLSIRGINYLINL